MGAYLANCVLTGTVGCDSTASSVTDAEGAPDGSGHEAEGEYLSLNGGTLRCAWPKSSAGGAAKSPSDRDGQGVIGDDTGLPARLGGDHALDARGEAISRAGGRRLGAWSDGLIVTPTSGQTIPVYEFGGSSGANVEQYRVRLSRIVGAEIE